MATIKSYTDIEQSRRLAKVLATETSDYYYPVTYIEESTNKYLMCYIKPYIGRLSEIEDSVDTRLYIPCWSLTALLAILNFPSLTQNKDDKWEVCVIDDKDDEYIEMTASNPVDVCVEMILNLR